MDRLHVKASSGPEKVKLLLLVHGWLQDSSVGRQADPGKSATKTKRLIYVDE
jgi:hypothetical protein